MKYTFEQFKGTIENPNITIQSVVDNVTDKTCQVNIILSTSSASFGVTLSGFTYTSTWEDSDIHTWVNTEIVKYKA